MTIYSTCALVGALVMSFLAPADARPETSPDNIWGDTLSPFIVEADHVLVVIAFDFACYGPTIEARLYSVMKGLRRRGPRSTSSTRFSNVTSESPRSLFI